MVWVLCLSEKAAIVFILWVSDPWLTFGWVLCFLDIKIICFLYGLLCCRWRNSFFLFFWWFFFLSFWFLLFFLHGCSIILFRFECWHFWGLLVCRTDWGGWRMGGFFSFWIFFCFRKNLITVDFEDNLNDNRCTLAVIKYSRRIRLIVEYECILT